MGVKCLFIIVQKKNHSYCLFVKKKVIYSRLEINKQIYFLNHLITNNYVKTVRDRFHYDSRFI